MTTIITDGKAMASDGQTTLSDMVIDLNCEKISVLDDGRIVGGCGSVISWKAALNWLNDGEFYEYPSDVDEFELIVIDGTGKVIYYDEKSKGKPTEFNAPVAIGTGMMFALAAYDAGLSLTESVQIAINRDIYSGGTIRYLEIS